jgi:hypothetical protein
LYLLSHPHEIARNHLFLLVEIDDPKMSGFIALVNYLSDFLGVKVDLAETQTLKPAIVRHVLEEAESYEGIPPGARGSPADAIEGLEGRGPGN